jgi:hypothetical protein
MSDGIDRHVEAQDLWESMQDDVAGAEDDYQADLAKDAGLSAMAAATGQLADEAEAAVARIKLMYDRVRQGPAPGDET